jgi:NAD(P)-dependent dehydrogenase (short-subunit alcohol dehydrogenase family)
VTVKYGLDGRTAIVTGAGRGIGQAAAFALAEAGAHVALLARTRGELDETCHRIHATGRSAVVVPVDLGDRDQAAAVVDKVLAWRDAPDILVNNAATLGPLGSSHAVDRCDYETAWLVNVFAPMWLTFALVPGMMERGWGRILNVSSGVAAQPAAMVGANAYAVTKAALEAHTLNLAAELDGTGVTVNGFRPGVVDTTMQEHLRDRNVHEVAAPLRDRSMHLYKTGGLKSPAESVGMLISRLSGDSTGQIWSAHDES